MRVMMTAPMIGPGRVATTSHEEIDKKVKPDVKIGRVRADEPW